MTIRCPICGSPINIPDDPNSSTKFALMVKDGEEIDFSQSATVEGYKCTNCGFLTLFQRQ